MPRLGSVVGSILAELAQARAIADHMSRDLVDEYEDDPVLATMPVPRMELGSVTLTLRFTVDELEEPKERAPEPTKIQTELGRTIDHAILAFLKTGRLRPGRDPRAVLDKRRVAEAVGHLLTNSTPTLALSESAFRARDTAELSKDVTSRIMANWEQVPQETRARLGSKASFQRRVAAELDTELRAAFTRVASSVQVDQALASRMVVGVRSSDLPTQPERVQEVTLIVHGSDLDVVLNEPVDDGSD